MSEENTRFFLNGKSVPLFNLDDLLKGYEPTKEDDIWDEVEEE